MVLNKDETMMFTADTGTSTVQQWHLAVSIVWPSLIKFDFRWPKKIHLFFLEKYSLPFLIFFSVKSNYCYLQNWEGSLCQVYRRLRSSSRNRFLRRQDLPLQYGGTQSPPSPTNLQTGQLIETLDNKNEDKSYNEIWDVLFHGDILFSIDGQGLTFCWPSLTIGFLCSWTNGVRKQILRADNDDVTERGRMCIYRDHLFVALKHIFIVDLFELKVKKSIRCPDDTFAMHIGVLNENLLVATEGKNLYCISLLLLEGNKEYLEAVPQWDNFTTLCKNQSEQVSKFRDSRDNTFLMYVVQFGTYAHMTYIVKNCKAFSVYEGNRYGECAISFLCKVKKLQWNFSDFSSLRDIEILHIGTWKSMILKMMLNMWI